MKKSILSDVELRGAAWMKIRTYIKTRQAELDRENRKDLSDRDTQKVRGGTRELERLLSLVEVQEVEFNESKIDTYR